MLEIKLSDVIQQLVDQFLDRQTIVYMKNDGSIKRPGLVFQINANIFKYIDDQEGHSYRNIFIVFCGGTNVFIASQNTTTAENRWHGISSVPLDAWENTSNHDSCWRSDGLDSPLSNIYFEMCKEVNEHLPKDCKCPPIEMTSLNNFGTFGLGDVFQRVTVTHAADKDDSYRRKIVNIERVDDE